MEIITLVENLAYKQGTKGEHGLSFLVKAGGKQILFDTGQSDLLFDNAKILNVDLEKVDAVVISHGHYDHTGGLEAFFRINDQAPVWLKPGALEQKLSKSTGEARYIGIDKAISRDYRDRFHFVTESFEIAPQLMIVPSIGHYYGFEQPSFAMLVEKEGQVENDLFEDELFMVKDHPEGLTVLAGCAHRGIANICRSAMELTANERIKLVLGGTHLKGASSGRIKKTVKAFEELPVEKYGLCHCTGLPAFISFASTFGEAVRYAHVGTHFDPYD
jgi:7,8-dihydropterin-6-yl-methyl-4-(beta-D-ribofuranosyl)aminobenzene 5'-phosphate synthase